MALVRSARLADIQAQQVEVGRIRLGTSRPKEARSGRTYQEPVKLDRFRLTSRSQQLIEEAAELYGGQPEPWDPQSGGAQQWEVIIAQTKLQVIIPPDPCSQFYEQWTGGRCTRRCNGVRELLEERPCPCGPDPAAKKQQGCKPTTRLSLMLAQMRGIGIWRLESRGYHAAAELPAVADLLARAGGHMPARLEMEQRSGQIPDPRKPGEMISTQFMVPVLHVESTPAAIIGVVLGARQGLEAGATLPQLPATPPLAALAAAPVSAITAAIAAEVAEPDQATLKEQWTRHTWYEDRINAAPAQDLPGWADKIRAASDKLLPQFQDNLLGIIAERAKLLSAPPQPAPPQPPPPAPTQPQLGESPWDPSDPDQPASWDLDPASPRTVPYLDHASPGRPIQDVALPAAPIAAPDLSQAPAGTVGARTEVWQRVMNHAAARGLTMSALTNYYNTFSQGGNIKAAAAYDLDGFLTWLQAQT